MTEDEAKQKVLEEHPDFEIREVRSTEHLRYGELQPCFFIHGSQNDQEETYVVFAEDGEVITFAALRQRNNRLPGNLHGEIVDFGVGF